MTFIIDIPIYRCSVVVLADATKEDWIAFCDEHKKEITDRDRLNVSDEIDEGIPGFVCDIEGNDYVCYISNKDKIGLVAHEIFHAAQSILWDRGYKTDKTAEPLAYLLEWAKDELKLSKDVECVSEKSYEEGRQQVAQNLIDKLNSI